MKKIIETSTEVLSTYVINNKYYCKGCKYHKDWKCEKKRIVRICREKRLKNV